MANLASVKNFSIQQIVGGRCLLLVRVAGMPNVAMTGEFCTPADDLGRIITDNILHLNGSAISTEGPIANNFVSETLNGLRLVTFPPQIEDVDKVAIVACPRENLQNMRNFLGTSRIWFTPKSGVKIPYDMKIERRGTKPYLVQANTEIKRAAKIMSIAGQRAFLHLQIVAELAPAKTFFVSSGWEHATPPAYPGDLTVNLIV